MPGRNAGAVKRPFVGRCAELALLERGLEASEESLVFRVSGPTGIGKTAILFKLMERCAALRVPFRRIDPVEREVTVDRLRAELDLLEAAPSSNGRRVLVVDDLHRLRHLERWLACGLLDGKSGLTVVLADRQPPSSVWFDASAVPACEVTVGPLTSKDVEAFFDGFGVAQAYRGAAAERAEGNPLLLTVACDAMGPGDEPPRSIDETTALIRLAASFSDSYDTMPERRFGFAIVLAARGAPYELLLAAFGEDERARAVFQWLRSLSFVEETPSGLRPHAFVRRACSAALRTHYPSLFLEAHDLVRRFCDAQKLRGEHPSRWVTDPLFVGAPTEGPPTPPPPLVALRRTASGEQPTIALLEAASSRDPDFRQMLRRRLDDLARQSRLTEREHEVFQLLVLGRNAQEIGSVLGITARTAKFHQQRVLEKIGADTRFDILRLLL